MLDDFGKIRKINEVITDHGTQFFANKTDKNGESESQFAVFLAKNEIKHILARVKHPQTNGKIEKWYHTYEKNRKLFDDFDKFLNWYNSIRYHESLDEKHYLADSRRCILVQNAGRMQDKSIPFENGDRFKCKQIDIKESAEYINAKHSGLYNDVRENDSHGKNSISIWNPRPFYLVG